MRQLNRAIANLYDASVGVLLEDFRAVGFEILREFVPFDSSVWASGRRAPGGGGVMNIIHTMHLIGQPKYVPAMFVTKYAKYDRMILPATNSPGIPMRIEDTMPLDYYRSTEIYKEFTRPHHIELAMGTMHIDELVDILDYIVLWRADRAELFTEDERMLKQTLSLHMVNAWKHCQLLELQRAPSALSTQRAMVRRARALVDDKGAIYTADADFGPIVQEIFFGWRGSDLPHEFAALIASKQAQGIVGGIECSVTRGTTFHVLTVTGTPKTMPLSAGEFEVARLFCSGLSNGEIARRRSVSPVTVRNQLASVYRKLDIHSKMDLARLIS